MDRPSIPTEHAGHVRRDQGQEPPRLPRPLPTREDQLAIRPDIQPGEMSTLDLSAVRYPTSGSSGADQQTPSHQIPLHGSDARNVSNGSTSSARRALPTPPKAPGGARPPRALPMPPRSGPTETSQGQMVPPTPPLRTEASQHARYRPELPAATSRISDMRMQETDLSRASSQTYSLQTSRSSASLERQSGVSSATHFTSLPATSFEHGSAGKDHQAGRYGDRDSAFPSSGVAGLNIGSHMSTSDSIAPEGLQTHGTFLDLTRDQWSVMDSTYGESSRSARPEAAPRPRDGNTTRDQGDRRRSSELSPSWAEQSQHPSHWVERKLRIHQGREDPIVEDEAAAYETGYSDEEWEGEAEEMNEIRFFQPALLSESALQLRDRVERRRHLKGGIAWVGSFTGRDIVVSLVSHGRDLTPDNYPIFLTNVYPRWPLGSAIRYHHGSVSAEAALVR